MFSQAFHSYLPENRRIDSPDLKIYVDKLLSMGTPKPRIQDLLLQDYNIHITAKDLQNLAQKLKTEKDDDLGTAINILKNTYSKFLKTYFNFI